MTARARLSSAPDGSSATMSEDLFLSPILLANDPGLGEPEVIFAGIDRVLILSYDFVEGAGNNDEFGVFVLNSKGISAGPDFQFFTQGTSHGTVSFDLSGLISEPYIGLQLRLSSLPGDTGLDSVVTISLHTEVIPEPCTLLLMIVGIGIISVWALKERESVNLHNHN